MPIRYGFHRPREGDDFEDLDPDELLALITDDLLENGDLEAAIDRLMRDGFTTNDGDRVEGLAELLERARARRRELENQVDPSDELARYRERLDAIERLEDESLDQLEAEAGESGDERRREVTEQYVDAQRLARSLSGSSIGDRIASLQSYEFTSSEARESFESLLEELRADVLATYFEQSKAFLENPNPAALTEMREMMDALSTMIEQDRRGEPLDPSFESFMERFGQFFPGATSLEDVVATMAERAAAAEAMFNALSSAEQAELRGLMQSMLGDMDLELSMHRLVSNLRQATPDIDWHRTARLRGSGGSFADATGVAEQLGQLRGLEDFLGHANAAQTLPEVDLESVRRNLGPDAAAHVARLQRALRSLRDQGFVDRSGDGLTLSAKGVRQIGQHALRDLFAELRHAPVPGAHRDATIARGGDREETSTAWEPGQPLNLHLSRTLRNAIARNGPGTPVTLHPDDFEVEEYEATRRSATVFAIDLSLSMAMRGNLVPAKKMVLALTQLIRTRFPRDFVAVVGFAETAQELRVEDVPALTIDYAYGTNLQHALALARHLMRAERGERQIVVVTDGEPTAHLQDDGQPFFSWPPVRETLERTMAEVLRCTKAGIVINTFALDIERSQFPFVEQIGRVNRGRTFYTSVDELGRYVLDDFVRSRRAS